MRQFFCVQKQLIRQIILIMISFYYTVERLLCLTQIPIFQRVQQFTSFTSRQPKSLSDIFTRSLRSYLNPSSTVLFLLIISLITARIRYMNKTIAQNIMCSPPFFTCFHYYSIPDIQNLHNCKLFSIIPAYLNSPRSVFLTTS